MELDELKVSEFVDVLSSDAPAPGGGSAAALEGALGAALASMVCALTIGKKKYADYQDLALDAKAGAADLCSRFMEAMVKDTDCYNAVSAAYKLPKETDDEKAARTAAIQNALKDATRSPFSMMELALETLRLTRSLVGRSNVNAASDLGVSALSLKAAVQGAWLNVLINLGDIHDEEFVADYSSRGERLLAEASALADEIYEEVLGSF